MSKVKGKIIDHFYGGITRDEKSRIDGVALNIEELDIFENANFVRAAQVMTRVATSSSSPSSSASASNISGTASPTGSPSASPSSSPSASQYSEIAFDAQATGATFAATTAVSWSHTNSVDASIILVSLLLSGEPSGITVTYGGESLTLLEQALNPVSGDCVQTWYRLSPASGTNTVSASWTGSYSGYGTSTSYEQVGGITTSGDRSLNTPVVNAYVTLTSTDDVCWWYGALQGSNTTSGDVSGYGSITTIRQHVTDRIVIGDSNGVISSGSQNGGFTRTAGNLYLVTGAILSPTILPDSASNSPSTSASGSPYQDLTFVGGATNSGASNATVTVDLTSLTGGSGTTALEGDVVIVSVAIGTRNVGDTNIGLTTSGYTEITDLYQIDGSVNNEVNLAVFYKRMGVTPDTSVVVTAHRQSYDATSVAVHVWRGVDDVSPLDVTSTTIVSIGGTAVNPPSITPTTSGSVVLAIGAVCGSTSEAISAPSGYSNLKSINYTGLSYDASVGIASKVWTSGAEDPGTMSVATTTNNPWAAVTLALRHGASDNSPSNSPSSSVSSSPSASVFPQDQTEITAYTGDLNDNAWGYGGQADTNAAQIFKLLNAGSDTPGSFQLVNISGDVVNEAFPQSPLQYHKTTEANAIYYLKKAGTDISLVRYDIDNDTEDVWTGSAWSAVPSSSPSPSPSASPSASAGESGDIPASSQLTGLTGTNDRYFMRVEFGELYISNGNYIAKVDNEGTFTEKAFQLPLEWEAVDITFVADVGLILARNINRKANFSKAFWWDLTSEVQFDNQITIPHGGPQWIVNFKERLYVLCAQNGVATFYSSVASPGVPLQKVPGMELANVEAETETQEISSPKMMAVKDGILYFGLYKTDKTGIYAIGSLDEDKPTALVLAKRFDTTDYSRHIPVALHTQGPNFYASYEDNGAFKHSRCESNNGPNRSTQAVYESVIFDEGDPTKNKDILSMYLTTKPLPAGTFVQAYISSDYGSFVEVLREDSTSMQTTGKLIGNFRGKSISGKTHQFKFQLTSNGTDSPIVTGLAYMVRTADLPAYG